MKGKLVLAVLSLLAVLAAGCSSGPKKAATGNSAAAPATKGVIAFSYGNESAGIYPIVAKPAKQEAEKRGYKFVEGSANGACAKQTQDLENFIGQKVKAIVVLPLCGAEAVDKVVHDAKAAGITVVGYSAPVAGGDAAVVYDNVGGATAVANDAIAWWKQRFTAGKPFHWALFTYDQCGKACTDRTDTIRDLIVAATKVKPLEAESVAEDTGLKVTETFLQKEPGLNMVIGINDAGALGAYQALVQQIDKTNRDPADVYVAGMDGQNEALQLIAQNGGKHGIYRASGALLLDQLGKAVADLPINILEGQPANSLLLNYVLVTPRNATQAQTILDTYNRVTGKG